MNIKRSDAMRCILDACMDAAHNFESLIEKLDQLDDRAFWAWWQENEKEQHMRAAGWEPRANGTWLWKKPGAEWDAPNKSRAWEIFRIQYGHETALPMMPIMLAFDPALQEGLADILNNPTAWTLWLLWKARHIVSQYFNRDVLIVAQQIDTQAPKTIEDLRKCFPRFQRTGDFMAGNDVDKFCAEALPFFTGEREVEFVINPTKP